MLRSILSFLIAAISLVSATIVESAPLSLENSAWNVNRNAAATSPAEYRGEWPGHQYHPSAPDWRRIGIYHLVTDRFYDGDPHNNEGKYGGFNVQDRSMRQGGDFRGLAAKLDYIKSLGFDAIWISPIFQNRENSYHGYGQIDFTLLDDRFGTLDELRTLVTEAHKRGMYIFVDIVVNHLSNLYFEDGSVNGYTPFHLHTGEYRLIPRKSGDRYADFEVDNTFIATGEYCPVYNGWGNLVTDHVGKGSFWNSDFQHNGALTDYADPWNITFGKIYGLYDDLRLCSDRVQDKIIAMTTSLIASADIDGIRMDTPMQVPLPFFKVWAPRVRKFAAKLGKENFPIFGETFATRNRTATMIGRGKAAGMYRTDQTIDDKVVFDGGIDYGFYAGSIEPIFRKEHPESSKFLLQNLDIERSMYDFVNPKSGKYEFKMLNFIGSHDQRRFRNLPDGQKKLDTAAALVALWPGIPLWYQGDEQALCSAGVGLDGDARESMMQSIAWDEQPSCQDENPASHDNFDFANPHFVSLSRYMEVRSQYPEFFASDEAAELSANAAADPGAILFRRGPKDSFGLLALNFSRSDKTLSIPADITTQFVDALTGDKINLQSSGGSISVSPYQVRVLVPATAYKALRPRLVSISPQHDSRVDTNPLKITLRFAGPMMETSVHEAVRCPVGTVKDFSAADGGIEFSFSCSLSCGVNKITVDTGAKSSAGISLASPVESRVLYGEDTNIIVNQHTGSTSGLVESGRKITGDRKIRLRHHACGARWMRTSVSRNNQWSPWVKYEESVTVDLNSGNGWQPLRAQYWSEGSAAYLVESGIDLYNPPWNFVAPSDKTEPLRSTAEKIRGH